MILRNQRKMQADILRRVEALEAIVNQTQGAPAAQAQGLDADMEKFRQLVLMKSDAIADELRDAWYSIDLEDTYIHDYLYEHHQTDECDETYPDNNSACMALGTKESIVLGRTLPQTLRDGVLGQVPNNRRKRTAALAAMLEIATNGDHLGDDDFSVDHIAEEAASCKHCQTTTYADRAALRLIVLLCRANPWLPNDMIKAGASPWNALNTFELTTTMTI